MKISLIILLLLGSTALAEHTEIELHITSHHFSNSSDFEEDNYGIGVTHFFKDRWGISAGGFNNSYDDTSIYLALTYTYDLCSGNTTCAIGAIAGGVTGYDDNISGAGEVRPVVIPEFKLGHKQYFIKSRFFPDTGSDTSAAITLSIGREF